MRRKGKWCIRVAVLVLCLLLAVPAAAAEPEQLPARSMLAVRGGASERSGIIGWMPDGQQITVLSEQGNYYRIDCYDMTGFVHKQLVRKTGETYILHAQEGHPDTAVWPVLPEEKIPQLQQRMVETALSMRGVPYVWGGTTPRGFDCSGFTQYVYRRSGIALPRTCDGQMAFGSIVAKEDLQPGDIIIFQGTAGVRGVSHVGMYIGDGKLIHAGSRGITVVELSNSYFTRHYLCARRVLTEQSSTQTEEMNSKEMLLIEQAIS